MRCEGRCADLPLLQEGGGLEHAQPGERRQQQGTPRGRVNAKDETKAEGRSGSRSKRRHTDFKAQAAQRHRAQADRLAGSQAQTGTAHRLCQKCG